jgi:hypothetical protein
MYGKINIFQLDNNNIPQVPQGLEYGISQSLALLPVTMQLSNHFSPIADGTYYIWWRELGGEWDPSKTVKEVVLCSNLANNAAAIQAYFDTYVWPVIQATQATASAAVQDLDIHNFIANNTSVGSTNAINITEDYSFLNLAKIVTVYIDGIMTPYLNTTPSVGDTTTLIYNQAGIIKWRATTAQYELTSNMTISIVVVV